MRIATLALISLAFGCAHPVPYKQTGYAKLKSEWTLESDFLQTWKGIEKAVTTLKIVERDPSEVTDQELAKLSERSLETDWITSRSRDKYVEYNKNGVPARKPLQTRYRYRISASRHMGGTHVVVALDEEIEQVDAEGTSLGFESTEQVDTSLAREMIEKIKISCHS